MNKFKDNKMSTITKDIKTIKELRKYVNSIDWYNKEWNEKDNEQFAHNLIVNRRNKEDNGQETVFKFSEFLFSTTISKKLQAKVYKLPFSTERVEFNSYRHSDVKDRLDIDVYNKYKDSDQTIRCYQLKKKQGYSSDLIISKAFIYANEYTDEILCVSYDRKDIYWNKFFNDCLDASIPNNLDELNRVKKWNLVLRKEEFKTILTEGKTFAEALDNFYKNNSDVSKENSEYKKLPNTWCVWGTTSLDKLPENENLKSANNVDDNIYYSIEPAELGNIR